MYEDSRNSVGLYDYGPHVGMRILSLYVVYLSSCSELHVQGGASDLIAELIPRYGTVTAVCAAVLRVVLYRIDRNH